MPPRLVSNEESWLAFTDLVFVDPVGTGFSRVIEDDGKDGEEARRPRRPRSGDAREYFGYKRDLESLCEFMSRWLSSQRPLGLAGVHRRRELRRIPRRPAGSHVAGDGGHRAQRRDADLAGAGVRVRSRRPTTTCWGGSTWCRPWRSPRCTTGARGRSRPTRRAKTFSPRRSVRHQRLRHPADARRVDAGGRARADPRPSRRPDRPPAPTWSRAPRAGSRSRRSRESCCATSGRCSACTTRRSPPPIRSPIGRRSPVPTRRSAGIGRRVHDGDQPAASIGDRRRDRSRVRGVELRGQRVVAQRRAAAFLHAARSAPRTTSVTACRSTRT